MANNRNQVAGRIRMMCSRLLERAPSNIEGLKSKEDWKAFGPYVHGACRNALRLAMLDVRDNNDLDSSSAYFLEGAKIAAELQCSPSEMLAPSNFDIPIFCCLISGGINSAKSLAEVVMNASSGQPGSYFDAHGKVLAAFVLSDQGLFQQGVAEFNKLEDNYWWGKQKIYFQLYGAVMEGDQESYNRLLNEANTLFAERAEDNDFGDQLGEYGGLGENEFVLDFMALGIAAVAKSKGMATSIDTKYFPLPILK